ncbi:hypothetical protein [Streptomyces sp. NPDC057381]|uniref:hypothetical protein n=1 Tax=Streptomyces sp. NPDC057381 TaxID=3346111 RepID=UPI0036251822
MPVTHEPWARPTADDRHSGTPPSAAAGRELTVAARGNGDEARRLARRLVGCLSPEARLVLLRALAAAGARPGQDGAAGPRPARYDGPPAGLIRLRFADASALERAGAAFGAGSGPGLGDARSDPAALTLQMAGDTGVESVRAVLAVLDAAAVTAESLTVHTRELGDVVAAFTGPS